MHTAEADLYKQGNIYAQGGRRSAAGRMLTEAVIVEKLSRPQDYHNSMTEDLRAQIFKGRQQITCLTSFTGGAVLFHSVVQSGLWTQQGAAR